MFNPQTRACTWDWDPAVKDRCNVRSAVLPQNNNADANTRDQIYANDFTSLKPTSYDQKEEELCPSDYSGLSSHPYDCKKFVNCWKGKIFLFLLLLSVE